MPAKKLIILSTHRSGSTWLLDMLRQHSRIQMYGEIFLDRPVKQNPLNPDLLPPVRFYEFNGGAAGFKKIFNTWSYLSKVDSWREKGKLVGYKVMYNHLENHEILLPLIILKRYKVLHLVRNNLLDTVVSHFFLQKTGVSNVLKGKDSNHQKTIHIPPHELLHRLRRQEAKINLYRRRLKNIPLSSLEVSYENLRADTGKVMGKIMPFLGLDNEDSYENTEYVKMNKKPYQDRLENYQEIYDTLKDTSFFKFIQQ